MKNKNTRIIKKLSIKAAQYLPSIKWETDSYCNELKDLREGTPVLYFRCSYDSVEYDSLCAWKVLERLFNNEKITTTIEEKEWIWGAKATPDNVFTWAYWNEVFLSTIKEENFNY